MDETQLLTTYRLQIKFLLLSVLPACLIACSTPHPISSNSRLVEQLSEIAESVEIQPKVEDASKRDVEIVEAKITNLLISRIFESAEQTKDSSSSRNLGDTKENGNPEYFLAMKQYRKQLAGMLKQGCIDDAYKRWNSSSYGSNYGIIDRLESFKWFASAQAWKVKDRQYLISFTCGHGMSLRENAIFLLTETASKPKVNPLRLVKVSRNKETGGFQFRLVWDTLVFGSFGPSFDEQTGELSIETKGNGSGQLRSSWKYKIENDEFVLIEFRDRGWDYKGSDIPRVYP